MKIPFWMLFLGFSAFVAIFSSLGLVYISSHNEHGLVRNDYYQAGLHLDEQRRREAGFDSLNLKPALKEISGSLVLELTQGVAPDPAVANRLRSYTVELFLQRPDDPTADRELVLQNRSNADSANALQWSVSTTGLRKGRWNCRLVFEDGKQPRIENSFAYNAGG